MPLRALIACVLTGLGIAAAAASTVTGADPHAADPVIAAAGDIACAPASVPTPGTCHQLGTSNLLVRARPAAVLSLGDNQYDRGELSNFNTVYNRTWGRVKGITHPAPGNHEYETASAAGYFAYFGTRAGDPAKGYHSFEVGTWHLIELNSNCSAVGGCGVGSRQERWLRNDLRTHPGACTLAYWHHPLFSSGSTHGGDAAYRPFWKALYDFKADVVLVGHEHNYERFALQTPAGAPDPARGIREFVVGTGGRSVYPFGPAAANSQIRNTGTFGVLLLTLHPRRYDWRFLPEGATTFRDTGSASCR